LAQGVVRRAGWAAARPGCGPAAGWAAEARGRVWPGRRGWPRPPQPAELEVLRQLLTKHRQQYAADQTAAASAVKAGETAPPTDLDAADWT